MSKEENQKIEEIRKKPFIVICGCTGTGKTKLSIQLAEWLNNQKMSAEIINADAMQLYENLNIITNKATDEEMRGIKHHLIGYLPSTCVTSNVIDYRNKAIELIDSLLSSGKIPIVVGGTHYYIHSILWDTLIDERKESNACEFPELKGNNKELAEVIVDWMRKSRDSDENEEDLNVCLGNSKISNEPLYQLLLEVDRDSALKLHPNDRRKLIRALQIYYTYGVSKSVILEGKNQSGVFGSVRYKNACVFAMNCEPEVLNKRLDERVDQMILNGLDKELALFKEQFQQKIKNQSMREYSSDFQLGIFQSIGFKEFDEYLEANAKEIDEAERKGLFDGCVAEMKASTRRYARYQARWVKNRFIKRAGKNAPVVYEFDTSELEQWQSKIFDKATEIFQSYLNRDTDKTTTSLDNTASSSSSSSSSSSQESIFEYNKCELCDKVFVDKHQWNCHLKGNRHKKRKESLKRKEMHQLFVNLNALKKIKSESVDLPHSSPTD